MKFTKKKKFDFFTEIVLIFSFEKNYEVKLAVHGDSEKQSNKLLPIPIKYDIVTIKCEKTPVILSKKLQVKIALWIKENDKTFKNFVTSELAKLMIVHNLEKGLTNKRNMLI